VKKFLIRVNNFYSPLKERYKGVCKLKGRISLLDSSICKVLQIEKNYNSSFKAVSLNLIQIWLKDNFDVCSLKELVNFVDLVFFFSLLKKFLIRVKYLLSRTNIFYIDLRGCCFSIKGSLASTINKNLNTTFLLQFFEGRKH